MATTPNAMTTTATIRLPFDRENKSDVYVEINGHSFLIKRGVDVTVPVAVKNVLERKERMLMIGDQFAEQASAPLAEM